MAGIEKRLARLEKLAESRLSVSFWDVISGVCCIDDVIDPKQREICEELTQCDDDRSCPVEEAIASVGASV